jgi:hypothetical protein
MRSLKGIPASIGPFWRSGTSDPITADTLMICVRLMPRPQGMVEKRNRHYRRGSVAKTMPRGSPTRNVQNGQGFRVKRSAEKPREPLVAEATRTTRVWVVEPIYQIHRRGGFGLERSTSDWNVLRRSTQLRFGPRSAIRLPWEVTIASLQQLMETPRATSPCL